MDFKLSNDHPLVDGYYLTDGGLETTLIFHYGLELPHFAAFDLLKTTEGKEALSKYYTPYLDLARDHKLNFILETPTWRANSDWGAKLGYSESELAQINREAVAFIEGMKPNMKDDTFHWVTSGNVGPRGDGYVAESIMTAKEAKAYHLPQIRTFAQEGVDLITALTINYTDEGIGIVQAAEELKVPVVISFTVETDGHLPCGETLREAIAKTDRETGAYTAYFMINCAHPEHFKHILKHEEPWKNRIRGIRANASTKSHAELDESETLDTGDKDLFLEGYRELMQLLPELKVIGGCCGSDHSHLEILCKLILFQAS